MLELTEKQRETFFHRSYKAVDGLWFMKLEEELGFDMALDIDERVWKIMPKIQARLLFSFSNMEKNIISLRECLTTRLDLEGFEFTVDELKPHKGFQICVTRCPWQDIIHDAGRDHLGATIGTRICTAEYKTWAEEFDKNISFSLGDQLCEGAEKCMLKFTRQD
jgi:hypothetical protein